MKLFSIRSMTGLLVLASVAPVWAQSETEEPAAFRLEEIVVTAQRRTSTIQKTPIAMVAISGDEIRDRQLNTIGDVTAQTPGVLVQNSSKGQSVFIRGIGSLGDTTASGDPAINLNIDGVYQQLAGVVRASTFDVSRVEVLRGPQGTLYGRNSNAGSVNVITNDPVIGEDSGYLDMQLGNYSQLRMEGAVNIDLADDVAARLAFVRNSSDGYYSNGGGNADSWATRGKLKFEPSDRLTLTLTGLYAEDTGSPPSVVPAPLNEDPYDTTYPAYDGTNGNGFFAPLSDGPTEIPHAVSDTQVTQFYAQLDYDLGFGTLTLLPAYNSTTQYMDQALLPLAAQVLEFEVEATSIEARIASNASSPIEWVAGLYGYDSSTNPVTLDPVELVDFPHNSSTAYPVEIASGFSTRSLAAFGQVTVPVTERFRVTGGARYTWDRKDMGFVTEVSQSVYEPSTQYQDRWEKGTYKGGVEFDVAPRSMLYAQVSTGYKSGGLNPVGTNINLSFEPESITAYEAGIKNGFLDNTLQLNLSGFYYDYKNYQANASVPDCTSSDGFSSQTINVGELKNYGGELELTFAPTRNDRFYANTAYLHSQGTFDYDGGICDVQTGVIEHDYVTGTFPPPSSPEWSGTVGYERQFDLPGGARLTARGDVRWSSSYLTAINDTSDASQQGSYTRTDASLSYAPADDRYSVRAFIRNIENDTQIVYTVNPPLPFASLQISDPRTYGVAATVKF